jgi:succinyl-CoA synthetase beta subunit
MRLYEFEGKILFRRFRIPVPDSVVIDGDNMDRLDRVVYPVVIKAQVFMGGRGKAGYVQHAVNRVEAELHIRTMLGREHAGFRIDKVLVERKAGIAREFYVAVMIDRLEHKPLIIAHGQGGMAIEEVAEQDPGSLVKCYLPVGERSSPFIGRKIAAEIGLTGDHLNLGAGIISSMYNMFIALDCKLVEINPLVLTSDNRVVALDSKVDLDEDAMYRHPEYKEMGISARHEVGELTTREKVARAAGIPYVDLGGDIGVFPGGAGFGIAAVDLITHYGGRPANFMDSGGAPTQEKLRAMLGLLTDNPDVKVIFGARFGGISRCDDWAKAVVQYIVENRPRKPMIMRMAGNMEKEGRAILEKAKKKYPKLFRRIKIYAYDTPIEEVIKETIRVANTLIAQR